MSEEIVRVFGTIATCDRADAGVGVIWWALAPRGSFLLRVLEYDLSPMSAINGPWIAALFERGAQLLAAHGARERRCIFWCEPGGLLDMLRAATRAWVGAAPNLSGLACDLSAMDASLIATWPAGVDARAAEIRPLVNSGRVVRIERGLRKLNWRGASVNHLVAAVRDHRPGAPDTATELMHAFILGVLLERASDQRMALPEPEPGGEGPLTRVLQLIREAVAPAPAPPPRKLVAGVSLSIGLHEIDGARVLVERNPEHPHWPDNRVALAPGRHLIDGRVVIVSDPAVGIRVELPR